MNFMDVPGCMFANWNIDSDFSDYARCIRMDFFLNKRNGEVIDIESDEGRLWKMEDLAKENK